MKRNIFVFAVLLLSILNSSGTIIQVPDDSPAIQQAIDMAVAGDTVLVAPGVYYENIRFMGKNITVASHFILGDDPSYIISTTINGSQPIHPDTASCVLFIQGEDSTAVLAGFTLTGGTGTVWEDEHNLNHWYTEGGGVLIQYSSPTIRNNLIINNEATAAPEGVTSAGGGAIRSGDSNPYILNNVIMNNQGLYGAGIVLNYSGAVMKNNIIAYNSGGEDYGGGGVWTLGNGANSKLLENNTIVYNQSANYGGGIRIWSSTVSIVNCIFWGNTAASGPQIHGSGGTISYSCIEGGYYGTGNLEDDPLFSGEQYLLGEGSPCIDSGNPDALYNDPEDPQNPGMALFPAQGLVANDMGAYGGPMPGGIDLWLTGIKKHFSENRPGAVKLFPNPVSGDLLSVAFDLDGDLPAFLSIHDSRGSRVYFTEAVNHRGATQSLNLNKLNPGIHFLTVETLKGRRIVEKLIVQ